MMKSSFQRVICLTILEPVNKRKEQSHIVNIAQKEMNNYNANINTTDTAAQQTRVVQGSPVDSTQPQLERSCAETRMT